MQMQFFLADSTDISNGVPLSSTQVLEVKKSPNIQIDYSMFEIPPNKETISSHLISLGHQFTKQ